MKKGLSFGILIVLTLFAYSLSANAQGGAVVHVFRRPESSSQGTLLDYLGRSGCDIRLHDLDPSWNSSFSRIVLTLMVRGVRIQPPEACVSCQLVHQSWDDLLNDYAAPLVGYFHEGRLTAMTLGITDVEVVEEALSLKGDCVEVFTRNSRYTLSNESVRIKLEELFQEDRGVRVGASTMVWPVILLAAADSINPCTFAAYTALLLISLSLLGRKRTLLTGFSFVLAVFLSYSLLGIGLIYLFADIAHIDKMLAVFGLAIGAYSIIRGVRPELKSPVPRSISRRIDFLIRKTYVSPLASFLLGVLVSFTLLPCSSGPYIVGLSLISTLGNEAYRYFLLMFYNLIFVAPLVVILLAIIFLKQYARKVKVFRSKRLGLLELVSGLLLVLISIYILFV
ncbi:MAG: cytochrome c biogenesis CcdA family protein [Nitrososphaeria archaeon]